jgi:hypothetical protein
MPHMPVELSSVPACVHQRTTPPVPISHGMPQIPIRFPPVSIRNTSVLFLLNIRFVLLVVPIKSFTPIAFPERDQSLFGAISELVDVHVARPLASDTRTLLSHGEPQPIVT